MLLLRGLSLLVEKIICRNDKILIFPIPHIPLPSQEVADYLLKFGLFARMTAAELWKLLPVADFWR
jgi:hypothetical protein